MCSSTCPGPHILVQGTMAGSQQLAFFGNQGTKGALIFFRSPTLLLSDFDNLIHLFCQVPTHRGSMATKVDRSPRMHRRMRRKKYPVLSRLKVKLSKTQQLMVFCQDVFVTNDVMILQPFND
ncbi:MAG: hypothetical protein KatS3mg105_2035 [Gemmatales bacterium]|nr:MAG: hypothetical protein KatS3mg105_2035 [Gemmatales bacterium]